MEDIIKSTIEQDIIDLERKLQEKKAELGGQKPEKQVFHGVVGEKIKEHVPEYQPKENVDSEDEGGLEHLSDEMKGTVDAVIKIVWDKNLEEGIREISKPHNIALIDAFHDKLTDELYDQLLEKKKLEKVE